MAKKEPRRIDGKVVAISGAARGIGRATATALLREGARVAIGDLDAELAQRTASELGHDCRAYALDVTDRESFAAFVQAVERDLGALDVMINNAGIMALGDLHSEPAETAIRQVDINLHGVITGTKLALATMRLRRTGHIVNIASYVGKISPPGGATYTATKHAVVGLTESVWAENRDLGIECTIVMPGVVKTELAAGLSEGRGVKFTEPEDVANAIVEALRFPQLDVYVPSSLGPLHKSTYILPRRAQMAMAKLFKAERVLQDIDHGRRAGYEERAAHSEPALEGESVPQPVAEQPAEPAEAAEPVEAS